MTRTFCDKCDLEHPPEALFAFDLPVDVGIFKNKVERKELCAECLEKLRAWLKPLPTLRAVPSRRDRLVNVERGTSPTSQTSGMSQT